ncbi:hypothetical protein D3C77_275390 [compost metagenome]
MTEVAYTRVGHQGLLAAAEELIEQWQVGPVVEHVGHQDQVETVGFLEEVLGIAQLHAIERGIRLAGLQGQWIKVASHDLKGACAGGCDPGDSGAGAKIQHTLAFYPVPVLVQVTGHGQAAGPAEAPVRWLVEDAPGFFRAEFAVHVLGIDQPQLECALG